MAQDSNHVSTTLASPESDVPLISCVCVTHNRVPMLKRAVACFLAQTHPRCELLVLHEAQDLATAAWIAALAEPSVRTMVVPTTPRLTLGRKRNLAVAGCRGPYMAVWDDDDWHAPQRLEIQLRVLNESRLASCTLRQVPVWDAVTGDAYLSQARHWECTLLARRNAMPPYADLDRGEDVPCVAELGMQGQLAWVDAPHLYIYTYHGRNAGTRAHFRRNIFAQSRRLSPAFAERVRALLEHPIEAAPLTAGELRGAG